MATCCRVSSDGHPRQSSQLFCLYPARGRSQGARSHHGLSPWRFWLYRVQSRGDTVIVWALDRRHNYTILSASQVGKSIDLVPSHQQTKFCVTIYINVPEFIYASLVLAVYRKLGIWLSLGGFHERGHDWGSDRRIYNSHIIIDKQGAVCHSQTLPLWLLHNYYITDTLLSFTGVIVSVYRKSHLFDVELPEKGVSLKESAFTIPGPFLVPSVQTPIGKVSFLLSYQVYSTFILWKAIFKMFPNTTGSHLRHSQTIQMWSWLANKLQWVLASPTISVLWINILKVHCTA